MVWARSECTPGQAGWGTCFSWPHRLLPFLPVSLPPPRCYPSPGSSGTCPSGAAWTFIDPSCQQSMGWSHPSPLRPLTPLGSAQRYKGPWPNNLARCWCPPGAWRRNELQRGSGGALAARCDGGLGCHGDAAPGVRRRKPKAQSQRGGLVSPSSPRMPRCLYVLTSRESV